LVCSRKAKEVFTQKNLLRHLKQRFLSSIELIKWETKEFQDKKKCLTCAFKYLKEEKSEL